MVLFSLSPSLTTEDLPSQEFALILIETNNLETNLGSLLFNPPVAVSYCRAIQHDVQDHRPSTSSEAPGTVGSLRKVGFEILLHSPSPWLYLCIMSFSCLKYLVAQ